MEIRSGIGVHAVSLGKTLGPAGHLFLYEHRPKFEILMRQNLAANGIANITIMKRAVRVCVVHQTRVRILSPSPCRYIHYQRARRSMSCGSRNFRS